MTRNFGPAARGDSPFFTLRNGKLFDPRGFDPH
jgi:hypothetical protein